MKVVYLEDVPGSGRPGDVKDVRDGYARNYLFPRRLAAPATPSYMQQAQKRARLADKHQSELDSQARGLAAKIEGVKVTIAARVGEQGRLYGSVTASDIAEALAQQLGQEIDRHLIRLAEPIKEPGELAVTVHLTRNVEATVQVAVVPES